MSPQLTPQEVAAGDELATLTEKIWGWYLAGGILSILFGFFVLSYKTATLYAVAYFAGAFFLAVGIFQVIGSFRAAKFRWAYLIMGVISIGGGIVCLVWPHITLYVIAIIIGWMLLFWGVTDIVGSLMSRQVPYWWLYLIRGIISIFLGIWAIRHPGNALVVLVVVIGFWCVLYGTIETIGAFSARHAVRNWEAMKHELGV
jgi:uncharacterized membrane protein HdeD (DUF308 family)